MTAHARLREWLTNGGKLAVHRTDAEALLAEYDAAVAAIGAFIAKYDVIEPELNGMFATQFARTGQQYRGENWATELAALRAILSADPS
jgi:hypothetical protein